MTNPQNIYQLKNGYPNTLIYLTIKRVRITRAGISNQRQYQRTCCLLQEWNWRVGNTSRAISYACEIYWFFNIILVDIVFTGNNSAKAIIKANIPGNYYINVYTQIKDLITYKNSTFRHSVIQNMQSVS